MPKGSLEAVQHFAALAQAVASERDLKAILKQFSEHLPDLLPFHRTSISIVEGERRITWHIERGGKVGTVEQTSSPKEGSLVKRVMDEGLVIVDDIGKSEPRFEEERENLDVGSHSMISYPLMLEGRTIGTMNVESTETRAYDQDDEPIVQLIASQIAVAIDRAHVFGVQEQRLQDVGSQLVRASQMATVGQLAAVVAHEVKNRFNTILLGARLLQHRATLRGHRDDEQVLASMLAAVRHGADLMQEFLRYARPVPPKRQAVNLAELLRETLRLARRPNIRVRWDLPEDLPLAWGDPRQLGQVFVNLVLNAIDAMPQGGELCLHGRAGDGGVIVAVADTGVGIPREQLPHIFEPFHTTKKGGTGLGTSISRSIVESNGGTIDVESTPGQGTTFTVRLAAAEAHQAA